MNFYVLIQEKVEGPITAADVQSRLDRGQITGDTLAWRAGWPEWKTVIDALGQPAHARTSEADTLTPPPLPARTVPAPPSYTPTLLLASILFLVDGWLYGSGMPSGVFLVIGTPILLVRAMIALRNRRLFRRRLASFGIYFAVAAAVVALVREDRATARIRANLVIAACEAYRKTHGAYPRALTDLVPLNLPAIPRARELGIAGDRDFEYFERGRSVLSSLPDSPVLVYITAVPSGRSFYVFEEKRWVADP